MEKDVLFKKNTKKYRMQILAYFLAPVCNLTEKKVGDTSEEETPSQEGSNSDLVQPLLKSLYHIS
jgi:hypothetical protein